jgi:hypothetical protein
MEARTVAEEKRLRETAKCKAEKRLQRAKKARKIEKSMAVAADKRAEDI